MQRTWFKLTLIGARENLLDLKNKLRLDKLSLRIFGHPDAPISFEYSSGHPDELKLVMTPVDVDDSLAFDQTMEAFYFLVQLLGDIQVSGGICAEIDDETFFGTFDKDGMLDYESIEWVRNLSVQEIRELKEYAAKCYEKEL